MTISDRTSSDTSSIMPPDFRRMIRGGPGMRDGATDYTPAEAALALAEAGVPVFPCDWRPKPQADQRYPGEPKKSPLTKHGFKDATADEDVVAAWWRQWPDALPGVPMGAASGLFVVDADIDEQTGETTGEATLAALGLTPESHPHVGATRSGGWHFFFRWRGGLPGCSTKERNGLAGVDIRSEGGYAIAWDAAALIRAAGAPDLPEPPEALRETLRAAKQERGAGANHGSGEFYDFNTAGPQRGVHMDAGSGDGARAWAEAALAAEIAALRASMPGGRNDALVRASFKLAQVVGGGLLDRARVEAELMAAALATGLPRDEAARTIRSGMTSGMAEPRGPSDKTAGTDKTVAGSGFVSFGSSVGGGPAQDWPEPDLSLLRPERGAPPPFPGADVFGEAWSRWIATAAEAKGAPPDYVAAALIAATGSLIGNARWVAPWEGWAEPPVLWAMLIGTPSAGKSPALDAVVSPLRKVETRVQSAAEAEIAEWQKRAQLAKPIREAWEKAVKAAVAREEEPPEMPEAGDAGPTPHMPRLMVSDATIEALAEILSMQPKGPLLMRDELSGWLGNLSRYANGGSDGPFWLEAYGGRCYPVERKGKPPLRVSRLTIGVLGGIQPDRLTGLLVNAADDGMLARHMPVWPDPVPIKRPERRSDDAFVERAFERFRTLDLVVDEHGARPWLVPFDEEARALMERFMHWLREAEQAEAGLMVSLIGKGRGFAARLALILAYLDCAASGAEEPRSIDADHFGRACHFVTEYLVPMARRAYAEASVPREERGAQRLARLIMDNDWKAFTSRDVQRAARAGIREKSEIEGALDVLVQAAWVRAEAPATTPKGGRPRVTYRVNPRIGSPP